MLRSALLAAALVGSLITPAAAAPSLVADPAAAVNTFIGTQDAGNTFPGAAAPFGMTQVSPIGTNYAGYEYTDTAIKGFGHFFLSGAGCWEQGGLVGTLPVTGDIAPGAAKFDTSKPTSFDHDNYQAAYTHDGEVGKPGDYRVKLTGYGGIDVATTATTRVGLERYTFDSAAPAHVLINTGQANAKEPVRGSSVKIVNDRTVEGTVTAQAFCGGGDYTTYFVTTFDRPFSSHGTWSPTGGVPDSKESSGGAGLRGAWLSFDNKEVIARTSISYVDLAGARANLRAEGNRGFDQIRTATAKAWRNELRSIEISTPNTADATVFYTALYHVLLQPLTGTDVDGRYRGLDKQVHRAIGWTYYQYFSLWDTYRGQNQLLALLRPDRARDIARSILAIHDQGGWLPRWVYADYETNTMTGDPVTPYLVDLWRFGALRGMESKAFAALKENATRTPPASLPFSGRSGNTNYTAHGFVQYDEKFPHKGQDVDPQHGASATLEYSLADCSLSIMAAGLGKNTDAATLRQRGQNYQVLWDASTSDHGATGFPRPRLSDGTFYTPATGPYDPTSQSGFHEGTAWQYQWMHQQDIPGMLALMGGKEKAAARLDIFFDYPELVTDPAGTAHTKWVVGPYSYYNQFRYNPNNEPDLHTPWMYDLIGQPWKTSAAVRAAQTLFVNAPNGVTGNDDLGEMSAWYVLSALAMYPATPGTGQFLVNAPRFPYAALHLGNGHTVTISAPGTDSSRLQYISAAKVNGRPYGKTYLPLTGLPDLTVSYQLTSDPTQATWATTPSAAPLSPCASQ